MSDCEPQVDSASNDLPLGESRRSFLWQFGGGFGGVALAHLLGQEHLLADQPTGCHHPPRAKRVVQLFMNGGVSQVDTFDYKPALARRHGESIDFGIKAAATSKPGAIMQSPFRWRQHGESGRWASDAIPHMAQCVDDMAFLMAMASKSNVHGPASYMQNTGFITPGYPCLGSWLSYGLGRLSDNLPSFVVLPDPLGLPYNGLGNFSQGFLPAAHQGTLIQPTLPTPIANLHPPNSASYITQQSESAGRKLLEALNRRHQSQRPGDSRLEARIASYEMAARMQLSAPQVLDLSKETQSTRDLYGLDREETAAFGTNCLIARRLLENDVRFVQVWSGMDGAKDNWDNHASIQRELPKIARTVDKPIAGLLQDLKQRGMLEDTLVVWSTEFGRMPFTQGQEGRDHNGGAFVTWLAGAGIRRGAVFGQSDEFGYQGVEGQTYCYDLHATILHLLGIDHTRLTVRHNGIDRRLTDVHGHVIHEILG
ncbi:MAG: DUF1501 domain-containing protein [Planctomycetales bacterium]|nr:DUF1501 domain-containing protein [Planctomycetales bacterium]